MSKKSIQSICVYCGSRFGAKESYKKAAIELGEWIAASNRTLVYGAGSIGLMGATAQAVISNGGDVVGIIPTHLDHIEITQPDMRETIITDNMHQRKHLMFEKSDAFILLPGGFGSMDEFFEMLTWAQLRLHCKPIYLYNVENYWQPVLALIDHIINEGFADASNRLLFEVVNSLDALAQKIDAGYEESFKAKDKLF